MTHPTRRAARGASLLPCVPRIARAAPKRGGVLKVLLDPEPSTLTTSAGVSLFTSSKTNEGLRTYDFDLTPKPRLATEWSVSADGPRLRLHDRQHGC